MNLPDTLLNLPVEDLEEITKHFAREQTEYELVDVLRATRAEDGGLSIEDIARVISERFDSVEVKALINALQTHED